MGILKGPLGFTGRMGKFTAYTRKGSDKIIIRQAKGPSKEQIRTLYQYERTRENNAEFAACNMFVAGVRDAAYPVLHLGDPNFTGALVKLAKKMQELDEIGERGERGVFLSRLPHMLTGFNFNINHPFDGLMRHPVAVQTSREEAASTVTIPRREPGVNVCLPWKSPFYRFVLSLGPAADVQFGARGFECREAGATKFAFSEWQHKDASLAEESIAMKMDMPVPPGVSLVLGIGIEMGMPDRFGEVEVIKGEGGAKVLAVF
ncbi:hypothetical protein [Chitinophaga sp.]|uniref:hypothetical protein n=1 Tax=Chitinophaga sp. TaxID=1869181 RepID=UPI0031D672C8